MFVASMSAFRKLALALVTAAILISIIQVIQILEIELAAERMTVSIGVRNSYQGRGTSLRGKAAEEFSKHLECFGRTGRWVYNNTPRYIPPKVWGAEVYERCDKRWHNSTPGAVSGIKANEIVAEGGNWKVREDLKWQWKTDETCPFMPFNRHDFCRRVGNRNILIVGDSISQEVYYMLMDYAEPNTTGVQVPLRNDRTVQTRYRLCADVVDGGFYAGFVRNDRLSLNTIHLKWLRDKSGFTEFPWIHLMHQWNVSLLLLNRGAHFEGDGNYTETLRNTYHVLQARYPSVQVFYRSTPRGHLNCSVETGVPLTTPQSMDKLPHHWEEYERQNELAHEMTDAMGYIFLDVAIPVNLRPEAHANPPKDCLHYCLPGPLDVTMELFYNALLLLPNASPPAQKSKSRWSQSLLPL